MDNGKMEKGARGSYGHSSGLSSTERNMMSDIKLPDDFLAKLYQSYSIKQRRAGLGCFLSASIIFDLWAILVPQGQSCESLIVTCIFLGLNICLGLFLWLCGKSRFRGAIWEIAPHLAWLFAIKQLFLQLFLKGTVTPRDSLGWAILLNFLVYVTLPVPLKYTGILLGLGSFATYINTIIGLAKKENYFWEQQSANGVLIATSALIGLLCYFLGEAKQRRAFLEAKKSLEVKMLIEEQSAEQERLLLSVLPEHVAVKMRQDLGSTDSEQFKKIYMSRHENVSILYADIVGFTAISSTYCAQDLVKMLNDLFARFDRLAEKYQQLRIKILGDCYYCISGAPVERPDHAVLCVHMGLSMVKAIKYVQKKTNSPVDMRVGIHTGAVLAGILGQRQWQFDVYSKDVELANKMESSGMAGRVHISEKTLGFLNGEFEVEPAYGEKREETLRIAGLKTYFITKVLIPWKPPVDEQKNGVTIDKIHQESIDMDGGLPELFKDDDENGDDEKQCIDNSTEDQIKQNTEDKIKEEDFKMRLRKELVSRDGHGELSKDITMFLSFKNKELELSYATHREPLSSVPLVASLFVHIIGGLYSLFVLPRTLLHFMIIIIPLPFIIFFVLISIAESFPRIFSENLSRLSKKFNNFTWLRRLAAIITILLIGLCNFSDMITTSMVKKDDLMNKTIEKTPIPTVSFTINDYTEEPIIIVTPSPSDLCLFPSYFSNYTVLILIATAIVAQLSHFIKIILMIIITGLHCFVNIFYMEELFRNEEYHTWNNGIPLRYSLSALLFAVTIALSFLARHMDKEDRVIFMWKTEVTEQKEKASDMRRRNEALVYNILPMHVAEHFMGNRRRSHDELYSQSYAEVGVIFASMPNFSDFYSEETVNNQGLECLRFLNEVISDFDALLEFPQFQDIIKIKTIGSTYMAASGLNPSRQVKPADPIMVRWAHLALLVEFALELTSTLQSINEQSFNHFVLKMGINHGPITAGVIGARKPHYDIWGNTVNVASRMESTGKAGAVQVTEETCHILQNFGYSFEQRGLVAVKGKGQLMTYYLQGKASRPIINAPASPLPSIPSTMDTVPEVDETKESPPAAFPNCSDSPIPQITSYSSSSASPNSVLLNHEFVEKQILHKQLSATMTSQPIIVGTTNTTEKINKENSNVNKETDEIIHENTQTSIINEDTTIINKTTNDDDLNNIIVDVQTPLLLDKNSTNFNSKNEFSVNERESLLDKK